jgi:hypothetical protein
MGIYLSIECVGVYCVTLNRHFFLLCLVDSKLHFDEMMMVMPALYLTNMLGGF